MLRHFVSLILKGNIYLKSDFDDDIADDITALLHHLYHQRQQSHLTHLIALMQLILTWWPHLLCKYVPFGHRLSGIQKAVKLVGSYCYLVRNALSSAELHSLLVQLRFVMKL